MSTSLQVILDDVRATDRDDHSWYGRELTRALIQTAPADIEVEAITAALPEDQEAELRQMLPGLARLRQTKLPIREMRESWLHSITTLPVSGILHATSLFAPLRRRDAGHPGQSVVTLYNVPAAPTRVFLKALSRAWKYADGIVVPTFAAARAVDEIHDFGDRLRVVPVAADRTLLRLSRSTQRISPLGLPDVYAAVLTSRASPATAVGILDLLEDSAMPDVPIVVIGPVAWRDQTLAALAVERGIPPGRIIPLGELDDRDFAVALSRASAYIHLDTDSELGLAMHAAFLLGCPVIHPSTEALDEIASGAGFSVPLPESGGKSRAIATSLSRVLSEPHLADELTALGRDHAERFTWQRTAEQVWQFHAEL